MNTRMPGDTVRYFLSYRGVRLPLALADELEPAALQHRGTYFRAHYDAAGLLIRCEKLVYGEVELEHVYEYDPRGQLTVATVTAAGDEPRTLTFGATPS